MAIEWLAGNRIRGTSTERTSTSGFNQTPAVSGGWKEVARHTLGSNANPILASSIPDKRYYMVLYHTKHSSGSWNQPRIRFGNGSTDAGSNYAHRYAFDYGSDTTTAPNTYFLGWAGSGNNPNQPLFGMFYVANKSDKEKLVIHHATDNDATGNTDAPRSIEQVAKWTNTSNVLDRIELNSASGTSDFTSGDEVVVLGWDPDDTHTDNFFEELASVDLSGGTADNISSGTFTAKKYLWVQCFMEQDTSSITGNITFNGDTGSNYCRRRSNNGAAQSVGLGESSIDVRGGESKNRFENMFIKNIAGDEKLVIGHHVVTSTGASNAPDRTEYKAKWTNTSNQITSINFANIDPGNYGTKSFIKVWGSN